MATIREIGEAELERFLAVVAEAAPRADMGGVTGMVDWRRQAEAMIWLLAGKDGAVAGAGYALTGWHTPRHRGIGAALVLPDWRGHGIGDELRAVLERWAGEHGATELEGPSPRRTTAASSGPPRAATRRRAATRGWCST